MVLDFRKYRKWDIGVDLNRSKSLYIRYLVGFYLKNGIVLPVGPNEARDVRITARCLQTIKENQNSENPITVDAEDCGAAYRFLLSVLAITKGKWFLTGTSRMTERPIDPLIDSLVTSGADITKMEKGIFIHGKELKGGDISVDCSQSSQFASSLLLMAPYSGISNIRCIPTVSNSLPYIQMTEKVIREIEQWDECRIFPVNEIERDWSSALFWYAVTALRPESRCTMAGLVLPSSQGDSCIARWFTELGVETRICKDGITISGHGNDIGDSRRILAFNVESHPDTVPVMACLSVLLNRELILTGTANLNYKESRRLDILAKELSRFAKVYKKENDSLLHIIPEGRAVNRDLSFSTYGDHRFVMAFTLFSLCNNITIDSLEPVKKSYPLFMNDLGKIG